MASALATYLAALLLSLGALWTCTRLSTNARRRPRDPRRLAALTIAILAGLLVLFSPLDELSDRFFSAHMVEHELLLFTMPIALLAARPLPVALIAPWRLLPSGWRRSAARRWNWGRRALSGLRYLERPTPALVLSTATLWLWHAPALYDLALKYEWVHTLEHVLFLATALLYWRPLLGGRHSGALDSNAKRTLYLVAGAMQGGLLGGLIALDPHLLYVAYLTDPGMSQSSALADQQLGGAIMWFSGPIFYSVLAGIVMDSSRSASAVARSPPVFPIRLQEPKNL